MPPPYTFANLEIITGGDPALDIEVLEAFLKTSHEYLIGMQADHHANDSTAWQDHIHALKSSCWNIGADRLGEICETVESLASAPSALRALAMQKIEAEFAQLEQAILNHIKAKKLQR